MGQFFRLWIILAVTIFVGAGCVLTAARLSYRDPFAPYRAFMPGQSVDDLNDSPCQFRDQSDSGSITMGSCQFHTPLGVFHQITLIASEHIIKQMIASDIQPGSLRIGDIILCRGNSSSIVFSQDVPEFDAHWRSQFSARGQAAAYRPDDYFLSIRQFSIGEDWMPVRGEQLKCVMPSISSSS